MGVLSKFKDLMGFEEYEEEEEMEEEEETRNQDIMTSKLVEPRASLTSSSRSTAATM